MEKLHFNVRPWSLLTILNFSARGPTDSILTSPLLLVAETKIVFYLSLSYIFWNLLQIYSRWPRNMTLFSRILACRFTRCQCVFWKLVLLVFLWFWREFWFCAKFCMPNSDWLRPKVDQKRAFKSFSWISIPWNRQT